MSNPYEPPTFETEKTRTGRKLPLAIGHPLVASLSLAIWIPLAISWFYLTHGIDPFHEIDVPFFFRLFIAIGGMFGLLSWYCARLVSLGHARVRTIVLMLSVPLMYILFVSLDQSPLVTVPVIAVFGFTAALCWIAAKFDPTNKDTDTQNGG